METFTDDTVVALASFLSPRDMLNLALTCKKFGHKNGTTTSRSRRMAAREESGSRGSREVRQRTESILSIMDVAARTVLHAKWTENEKKALPRRGDESWIGLYQEFLLAFRLPLQFDKLVGNGIQYKSNNTTGKTSVCSIGYRTGTAICSNIMRAGKHRVSFQVNDNDPSLNYEISCGIMRPTTEDITSLQRCSPTDDDLSGYYLKDYGILYRNNVDCCLVDACMGCCLTRKRWKIWEESELMDMDGEQRMEAEIQNLCEPSLLMEETEDVSFKIGMVLDFDEGTLDLYKNDRRIGTMKTGLVGEYCWVVSLFLAASDEVEETSVTIGR